MHLKALTAVLVIAAITAVSSVGQAKALSQPTSTNNTVTVAPGDTLSGIAGRNGTTYIRLFDANPQIKDPDVIYAGQNVRIPAADEQLPDRLAALAPVAAEGTPPAAPEAVSAPSAAPQASVVSRPAAPAAAPAAAPSSGVWYQIAQCESGGNWAINTGNGFYGGLQFTLSSWHAVGGSGYPNQASASEQIARAQILQARQGWSAWPACAAKLGLR